MTQAVPKELRDKVIREYLKGKGRNKIAISIGLGEGTVTNIIQEWRQHVGGYESDKIRELDINEDKFLKIMEDIQMKSIEKGVPPEMCGELLSQLFSISQVENLRLDEIPNQLRQKLNEIKSLGAHLKQYNLTPENINSYLSLKESLTAIGIHDIDIEGVVNMIRNLKGQEFDVNRVLKIVSSIIPLENREEVIRNRLNTIQNSISNYKQLIPLLQAIKDISAGGIAPIGLSMLLECISYRAATNRIPTEVAAQEIMLEIEQLHKLVGFEREIKAKQLQILALENKRAELDESWTKDLQAIETLVYLYEQGVTKDHIMVFNNFFRGNQNRITLTTLISDLNSYGNLKMTIFGLEEGIKTLSEYREHLNACNSSLNQQKIHLQIAINSAREKLYQGPRKETASVGKKSSTNNVQSKATQTTKTTSTTTSAEATRNNTQSDRDSVHTN
jgi:hypothetical protein